jgi:hypothetical protein
MHRPHAVLKCHISPYKNLVIVYDFDILRSRVCPAEADAPLIVDANAVLAIAVAASSAQTFAPSVAFSAKVRPRISGGVGMQAFTAD